MKKIALNQRKPNNLKMKEYCMSVQKGQHVIPSKDGWKVKKSGASKATKILNTQGEAVEVAKKIVKNQKTELFIHKKNGQIRERNSYGNDSFPPRG